MSITLIQKHCAWCRKLYCLDLNLEGADSTFCSMRCRMEWEEGLEKSELIGQYVPADGLSHDD